MAHKISHFDTPSTGVERACQIARQLFNHTRGNHDTDTDAIRAIAVQSRLSPTTLRGFLLPSRRPKDVSVGTWGRLVGTYRRYLQRELTALQDEIDRLALLEPDDVALQDLLREAETLASEIRAALPALPAKGGDQ